ncbi:MAG: rhodanese-like domain-containing protein [Litorilituus sp.]|jgi:rhodanese-related sulfurtransferase|nr:rhodanese-like domain-containing protein [Litorilituus sp.]
MNVLDITMIKISTLFTLLCSLVALAALASETPEISQQDLLASLNKATPKLIILDVRSAQEFNNGHIAGAVNISHENITINLKQLAQYKKKTVVVYCRSGRRAGIAESILARNGFTDLRHLTGDMNGWVAAKLPVSKEQAK